MLPVKAGEEAARDFVCATLNFAASQDDSDTPASTYLDALCLFTCELGRNEFMAMVTSLAGQLVNCLNADSIDDARDNFMRWLQR
jgi:hypothetical protein